jgi:hypothetical protein
MRRQQQHDADAGKGRQGKDGRERTGGRIEVFRLDRQCMSERVVLAACLSDESPRTHALPTPRTSYTTSS